MNLDFEDIRSAHDVGLILYSVVSKLYMKHIKNESCRIFGRSILVYDSSNTR